MTASPPPWWAALQAGLADAITAPLDVDDGRFGARLLEYPAARISPFVDDGPGARARLGLYHEQYWKRLFGVLQQAFPRTTRALGAFAFNRVAAHFLARHPPAEVDLSSASEPFFSWLGARLARLAPPVAQPGHRVVEDALGALVARATEVEGGLWSALGECPAPWSMVSQALSLDEAERRAFRARHEPAWRPTQEERGRWLEARPRYASSFSLVRLDFDLEAEDDAVARRRGVAEHHVVVRGERGVLAVKVDPLFARLLVRARQERLGDAIAAVTAAAHGALAARFDENLPRYFERALELGLWTGASFPPRTT